MNSKLISILLLLSSVIFLFLYIYNQNKLSEHQKEVRELLKKQVNK